MQQSDFVFSIYLWLRPVRHMIQQHTVYNLFHSWQLFCTFLYFWFKNFCRAFSRLRTPRYTWKSPLPAPALDPGHLQTE